jgi:isoleucyl-tRNA synthetase
MPETPAEWRDDALAAKWATIRKVRRVVTGALEVERTNKVIGASLEAAPEVFVDSATAEVLGSIDYFDDICITSDVTIVVGDDVPTDAFKMDDIADIAVLFNRSDGDKCQRCWKYLPDVGSHSHDGVCSRCDEALK